MAETEAPKEPLNNWVGRCTVFSASGSDRIPHSRYWSTSKVNVPSDGMLRGIRIR